MTEHEMEDLLWRYPEELLGEQLTPLRRQAISDVGRSDVVFKDARGRLRVFELKKGKLERGAIEQALDGFGALTLEFRDREVVPGVVAEAIPPERQFALDRCGVEYHAVPERKWREVAQLHGHTFRSENVVEFVEEVRRGQGIDVNYPNRPGVVLPGWWLADVDNVRRLYVDLTFYYDNGVRPEQVSIGKNPNGVWCDFSNQNTLIEINWNPSPERVRVLNRMKSMWNPMCSSVA